MIWRAAGNFGDASALRADSAHGLHVKNSFASETPATDGLRVYAMFGNVGLFCYDLDGQPIWSASGTSSRLATDSARADRLSCMTDGSYLVHDNETRSFVTVLDAATGREIWRVERPQERTNWTTPLIWKNRLRGLNW